VHGKVRNKGQSASKNNLQRKLFLQLARLFDKISILGRKSNATPAAGANVLRRVVRLWTDRRHGDCTSATAAQSVI
jgi:hypothetical protein